ncbi:hypothetical protein [Oceanisphaera sp. IT1-181]|uniref:hypothetical protein n=1 Tax=Oceanisphaera sp. IT1-181 TaxID=3081199 RepID=UPI0029CA9361|nr:hypothetical protein [Oceanisphaera sp. IT1-181]
MTNYNQILCDAIRYAQYTSATVVFSDLKPRPSLLMIDHYDGLVFFCISNDGEILDVTTSQALDFIRAHEDPKFYKMEYDCALCGAPHIAHISTAMGIVCDACFVSL